MRVEQDDGDLFAVGDGRGHEHRTRIGGAPHTDLRAVQQPAVIVGTQRRRRPSCDGRARLVERSGQRRLPGGDPREEPFLLRGGAGPADRQYSAGDRLPDGQEGSVPAQLVEEHRHLRETESLTAMLLGDREGQQPCLDERLPGRSRDAGVVGAAESVAGHVPHSLLGLRESEPHETALSSVSSSSPKPRAISHGRGTCSASAMIPTCTRPLLEITVMFSPAPWKTGPKGYIPSTSPPRK